MAISRKNPYGPIDPRALREFEATLPAPLLSDFRVFLTEFTGAEFPDSPELDDVPGGTALAEIFGLHDGPNYLRLDRDVRPDGAIRWPRHARLRGRPLRQLLWAHSC